MDEFSRLEEVLEGLKIFRNYGGTDISAEHDEIYCGPKNDNIQISDVDKQTLKELGWFVSDVGWMIFT